MEGCGSTMAPTYRSWKTAATTASSADVNTAEELGKKDWRHDTNMISVAEIAREQLVNRETSAASPPSRRGRPQCWGRGIGASAFGQEINLGIESTSRAKNEQDSSWNRIHLFLHIGTGLKCSYIVK